MKVLERAAGHASGPYRVPAIDVHADRRAHQQPDLRRVPRVRREPGAVRDGGRARPAGRAGRHQRVGDPQAQRDPARRGVGAGTDHGRRLRRRRGVPRRDHGRCTTPLATPGKAVGLGLGLKNSGLGNGFRELSRAVVRFRRRRPGRGAPRLDRDGPGRAHGRAAGRRAGAAASTPPASTSSSTRRASSGSGRPPVPGAP